MTAGNIILLLKVAVIAVTLLLICSLIAISRGNKRLHGRINIVVFILTISALVGLEVVARLISPTIFNEHFTQTDTWTELYVHLAFSVPSAIVLPIMLFSGLKHYRTGHIWLGFIFLGLWTGTLITGVFFLPH